MLARLAIVGITLGLKQARIALDTFRKGSFSGPMRKNIVSMLDHIGLAKAIRVPTCARLFDDDSEQVHFASAPRYPVFVGTANYDRGPNIFNTPLLKRMVETFLAQEVAALPNALASSRSKARSGTQLSRFPRFAFGRPYLDRYADPSGADMERISYFLGHKLKINLSCKTNPELIEVARNMLLAQVSMLQTE